MPGLDGDEENRTAGREVTPATRERMRMERAAG